MSTCTVSLMDRRSKSNEISPLYKLMRKNIRNVKHSVITIKSN